jgi:hypothetical protein
MIVGVGIMRKKKMNDLNSLIKNKDWFTLSKTYSPRFLAEKLQFVNALLLS